MRMKIAAATGAALLSLALIASVLQSGGKAPTEMIMPWYTVISTGDGTGPESVANWKEQPPVAYSRPPTNTFQDPTKWNGDHTLNGGNKEWSEEDAALHAYTMENWRNSILNTQVDRQVHNFKLMHSLQQQAALDNSPAAATTLQATQPVKASGEEKQLRQLTKAVATLTKAVLAEHPHGGARAAASIGGKAASTGQLLQMEKNNAAMMHKVMNRLRQQSARVHGVKHREHRLESRDRVISELELQNRKTMRQISQRLGDLSTETDKADDA